MWINAKDYDEAYEKLFTDHTDELLNKFLKEKKYWVTVEYGYSKPYDYKGCTDYEDVTLGSFEIDWKEFVEELGTYELLDVLREFCE